MQLDQLLTALQTNDRESLQDLLIGLGDGLMRKPSAADDADQDPDVQGETAAKSLNDSITDAPKSLKSSAEVNKALLGTEPHDLSKLIAGLDKVTTALATNEEQLKDFITNFNRFFAVFAREQASLTESIGLLGPTLENAQRLAREPERRAARPRGLRARPDPGRRGDAGHDHRVHAVDLAGEAAVLQARAGHAAGRPAARDAGLRARRERLVRPVRADQPHEPLLQRA